MLRIFKFLALLLFCCTLAQAKETNYLVPDLKFVWAAPAFDDYSAFALLGEVGNKNFRANGTYGMFLTPKQRLKVGVEGLAQNLKLENIEHAEWVYQVATGAEYEYIICCNALRSLEMGAAYSHAFAKNADEENDLERRFTGSNGGFFFVGPKFSLTRGTLLALDYNYDYVKYNKHFDKDVIASGSGISGELVQQLPKDFVFTGVAKILQPYNYYSGLLSWCLPCWKMTAGLYANYTDGKKELPNVLTGGLRLDFVIGAKRILCAPGAEFSCPTPCDPGIVNWVRHQAVYIPSVLTIADIEKTKRTCTALSINPASFDFGSLNTGDVASIAFTPTGTGPFTYTITGFNASQFSVNPVGPQVVYSPTSVGPVTATLTVRDACGNTVTAPLSGTGLCVGASGTLVGQFGNQQVGTTSPAHVLTFTGSNPINILIGGTDASDFSYIVTGPNTANVFFTPSSTGIKQANITVSNACGSTSIILGGNGT